MSAAHRFVLRIPPKSSALIAPDGSVGGVRIAMWDIWLDLAERHASFAEECRLPRPDLLDSGGSEEDFKCCGSGEIEHSMLAIASAAFAIDGFYGSVRPFVPSPPSDAARCRQILETLKHGFKVGKASHRWLSEFDWLFDLRDRIVHHAARDEPLQVVHETDEVIVAVAAGLHELGADSAVRAAHLAREVVDTCRSGPKPHTLPWLQETLYPEDLKQRVFPLKRPSQS
jgi:hypothetical protein